MQPVGLHQLLNKVGRQQTAHLHLLSVQPGSQVGHQAALLHPQLALEEEDLLGPQPVTGGHLLQQPLQAGHTSLVMAELALAVIKSRTVEILKHKENCCSAEIFVIRLHSPLCCEYHVNLLLPDVHEFVDMLVKPQLRRK